MQAREHLSEEVTVELRPKHEKELTTQKVERIFQIEETARAKVLRCR